MSIFSKVANHFRNKSASVTRYEMVTENGNGFYMWNGKLFQSDIIRACIRPKVKAIGKLVGKHIRTDSAGIKVNPEPYLRFLLEEPNPYMTGQMLQEKLATQLALNNNAFALIMRDDFGYPKEIYPLPATTIEAIYDKQGNLYLKFYFKNGKQSIFPYSDIIHLRRDFNDNDIFGESPAPALTSLMEIINTTDQAIVKAVKNSNVVRWLLKYSTAMRPEDLQNEAKKFAETYLSLESDTMGAAAVDSKADIQRIEPKDYVPNALLIDRFTSRIYSFFNTNENIVQSKYSENEWNSYYEAEIEPEAAQMAGEFTRKIFSRRERGFGNRIYFEASNLQWASLSTKLSLMQMVDRGAMTPNEWRETMGIDLLTGLLLAGVFKKSSKTKNGALESKASFRGLCKKGGILLCVLVSYRLDLALGTTYIKTAVIIGFMVNELISLVENIGLMGVPMPPQLTKAIELLKNKSEEEK